MSSLLVPPTLPSAAAAASSDAATQYTTNIATLSQAHLKKTLKLKNILKKRDAPPSTIRRVVRFQA